MHDVSSFADCARYGARSKNIAMGNTKFHRLELRSLLRAMAETSSELFAGDSRLNKLPLNKRADCKHGRPQMEIKVEYTKHHFVQGLMSYTSIS